MNIAEHGNAASLARVRDRADLTARRVRRRSIGRTEEAKASGNVETGGFVQQTLDGGFVLAGSSTSPASGNKASTDYGSGDFWVVRLDANGKRLWDKSFGGTGTETLNYLNSKADGQISLGGFSDSPASGNKTNEGQGDWMVRLDPNGEKLSEVWLGPYIIKVHPTQDGGLFAVRYASFGNYICALRVDANDNLLWDKFLQPFSNQQLGILALEELPDDKMQILGSIQSCCPGGPNEVLTLDGSGEIIRDQHIFQDTFFTSAAAGRASDGSWILCSDRFEVVNLKPAPDARSANLPLYSIKKARLACSSLADVMLSSS